MELGLLRKEDQHFVKTLSEALPVPSSSQREEMEEVLEQEKPRTPNYLPPDNLEQYGTQEQFVPYCVKREIRLETFVPQSLQKEQEGKSALLKEDLLFLKG